MVKHAARALGRAAALDAGRAALGDIVVVPPARARCMEPVLEGVEKAIMTRADLRGVPPLVVHIVGCSAPPAPTRGFLSDVLPHDLCTNMMFTVG